MGWDLASALAGAVTGAGLAVAAAWAMRGVPQRPRGGAEAAPRLTASWRLAELGAPWVVARDVEAEVPAGARLVAAGAVSAQAFAAGATRRVPDVPAEFAVDPAGRRALLFVGGVREGAQAVVVTDADTVARLAGQAQALWERAEPYLERRSLAEAAARHGLPVETQGQVQDVLPYQGGYLLRLQEGGDVLGVRVAREPSELRGQRVVVRGKVVRGQGGYPVLEAEDVRRLG